MKITICGSMTFDSLMKDAKTTLEKAGYEVEKPNSEENRAYGADKERNAALAYRFITEHFARIDSSDAVLIVNGVKNGIENYIGGNTLMEITYAFSQGLEVFLLNPVPDVAYADEIRGMQPIVLDGDIAKIDEHFAALPLAYMSTESPVKQTAVSRAFRKAGVRIRIDGKKVDSGVNEQPMTIEESYDGALNRHANLKKLGVAADYFVTIESGQHPAHKNHSLFGCGVVIIEPKNAEPRIGIDLDVEFPQEMLDKVPSEYPDLGVLVQKEYGAILKDPYPYFTNNKLTRAKVLENAVYNVVIQLGGAS